MDYSLEMEVLHSRSSWRNPARDGALLSGRATYQDPCRLGRHMGVYDPQEVMASLGLELLEMGYNRGKALCCGTSAWTHCGATAKAIQVDRFERPAPHAEVLVTTCAKCQIHFKCAQNDPRLEDELRIEVKDLTTLVAEAIS